MTRQYVATGAGGMVGSYLPPHVVRLDHAQLDVSDLPAVMDVLRAIQPAAVVHLAAATDVERSEEDREYAFAANTLGTLNVALACRELGVGLLYVSTGGVFSGETMASSEEDSPRPRNFYAWTKYEGERIVNTLVPGALIVRAGWMMGGGPGRDHKFVGAIRKAFKERDEVSVVSDRFGSPTYARHFVDRALQLLEMKATGVWHCANTGVCSRYEIATKIAEYLNYRGRVKPVTSDAFPTKAPRAVSEGLECLRLQAAGLALPAWEDALREYLSEFADD